MDNRILRGNLLENLNRFHRKEFMTSDSKLIKPMPDSIRTRLPHDVYLKVFEYLQREDFKEVALTCKEFLMAIEVLIIVKSYEYNLKFEKSWMYFIVFEILDEHFPLKKIRSNPDSIPDLLHLMSFKLITNQMDYTRIPRITYFMILSLIYEWIYGLNANVPINFTDWRVSFLRISQKFKLPLSKAAFIEYYERNSTFFPLSVVEWLGALEYLESGPSIEDQISFIARNQHSQGHYVAVFGLPEEFEIVIQENIYNPSAPLGNFVSEKMFEARDWTPAIINSLIDNTNDNNSNNTDNNDNVLRLKWYRRMFYRKFPDKVDKDDIYTYLWSRDSMNSFDIEFLRNNWPFDSAKLLEEIIRTNMPNLLQMDMASKLISQIERIDPALLMRISAKNWLIHEMIQLEEREKI